MFEAATAGDYYREAGNMSIRYLEKQVGGLSQTSKMPWLSYSLPAADCNTGSMLREIEGSVCHKCYACKGFYRMQRTKDAQIRRLSILLDNPERWAGCMAALIERKASNINSHRRYFRWHDSGDLQSEEHFHAIAWIAMRVPSVMFNLPTKEKWCTWLPRPSNLVVRHSVPMIGLRAPSPSTKLHATVGVKDRGFQCPAGEQDYECKDCRACWNHRNGTINYEVH